MVLILAVNLAHKCIYTIHMVENNIRKPHYVENLSTNRDIVVDLVQRTAFQGDIMKYITDQMFLNQMSFNVVWWTTKQLT